MINGNVVVIGSFKDTTRVAYTLAASGWSGGVYSFEATYPAASYDLTVEPANNISAANYKVFSKAMITGSATANALTAVGTVPTVDLPVILTVTPK